MHSILPYSFSHVTVLDLAVKSFLFFLSYNRLFLLQSIRTFDVLYIIESMWRDIIKAKMEFLTSIPL